MKRLSLAGLLSMLWIASVQGQARPDDEVLEERIAQGEAASVEEQMEAIVEGDDADADDHYWLAQAQLAQIDDAFALRKLSLARSARRQLEAAIALDPNHVAARESLAGFHLEAPGIAGGSKDEARAQADALESIDRAAAYRIRGSIALSDGDNAAAVQWMRRALAASPWSWQPQYTLIVLAVDRQVDGAADLLDEAERNTRDNAEDPAALLPLIDYQRGKFAAVSGTGLEEGQAALNRYLRHSPGEKDPALEWAQFRLAQVERQLGRTEAAESRLAGLEAQKLPEDLGFAVRDERRWHYAN